MYWNFKNIDWNSPGEVRTCTKLRSFPPLTLVYVYRKDDAANRPKLEFVPKTLADLNIEGVSDGVNGTNTNTHHHAYNTHHVNPFPSNRPVISAKPTNPHNQFITPSIKIVKPQPKNNKPQPKPLQHDPFSPFDPWNSQGLFYFYFLFFFKRFYFTMWFFFLLRLIETIVLRRFTSQLYD